MFKIITKTHVLILSNSGNCPYKNVRLGLARPSRSSLNPISIPHHPHGLSRVWILAAGPLCIYAFMLLFFIFYLFLFFCPMYFNIIWSYDWEYSNFLTVALELSGIVVPPIHGGQLSPLVLGSDLQYRGGGAFTYIVAGSQWGRLEVCRAPHFYFFIIFLFIKTFNGGGGSKPFGYMFPTPIIGGRCKWIEMKKAILKSWRSKRLVELKVHWDAFKRVVFLEWRSAVAYVR